jgi:hypothetical protein
MANNELVVRASVAKDLKRLHKIDVARIIHRICSRAETPRGPGCEKLSGRAFGSLALGPFDRSLSALSFRRLLAPDLLDQQPRDSPPGDAYAEAVAA